MNTARETWHDSFEEQIAQSSPEEQSAWEGRFVHSMQIEASWLSGLKIPHKDEEWSASAFL